MEQELEAVERRAAALRQAIALLKGDALLVMDRQGTAPAKSNQYEGLGIVDAAKRFILEVGEPRGTREIADALLGRGLQTKSKNFVATVYATLDNSKQFKRTPDGRWEPLEEKK
jgi:hypothetical protein